MATVLVTGGSGFLGTHLVERLLDDGYTVRVLDPVAPPDPRVEHFVGRLDDVDVLNRALRDVTTVFHLAAEHADDVSPRSRYYTVNVDGTRAVLDACTRNGVKRVVFTSTVAVYGMQLDGADEDAPTVPFNDYGASKLQAEQLVAQWTDDGLERHAVIVRPSVIIGPGNRGNVHNLFDQVRRRGPLVIGDGSNYKSMAYVDNVADFLVHCADTNARQAIFNYADKPDLSTRELVALAAPVLGHPGPVRHLPYALALVIGYAFDVVGKVTGRRFAVSAVRVRKFCASSVVDAARAHASGFAPRRGLVDGVRAMLAHEIEP